MVRPEHAAAGTGLTMTVLGEARRVTVIPESPYDPHNPRLCA